MRRGGDEDDFDDDEAELNRLRKASKYTEHSTAFGRTNREKPASAAPEPVPEYIDDQNQDDEQFRQFFPSGFGKQKQKVDVGAAVEATKRPIVGPAKPARLTSNNNSGQAPPGPTKPAHDPESIGPPKPAPLVRDPNIIGPPRPPPGVVYSDSDDEEEDEEEEEEEEEEVPSELPSLNIPITHEIELKGHSKPISALAWDPSGARLLTGGFDYTVKFWDFGGMDKSLRSFREIEPMGGHQIRSLMWSSTGDRVLIASGSAQPKIFDRDGFEISEFVKGDQYLSDMAHTKGHIAAVSNALWHPNEKNTILTSSIDGTVRIWDANNVKKQKTVIKSKNDRGVRTGILHANYGLDAKLIAAACQDGSIQIWKATGPFTRPDQHIREAHVPGTETSCILFSFDGHTMVTRGGDDTMKIWDLRNLKSSVHVINNLPNTFEQTDCVFSPDERFIVTGTSVNKKDEAASGLLKFYDKTTFKPVQQLGISKASVIRILWHKDLNQIAIGSSDNVCRVLYDPVLSTKGALMCVVRNPRKQDPFDYTADRPIYNPHSLPMYKPEPSAKRKREKARKDPIKSKKPDIPLTGPGVSTRAGANYAGHLLKKIGVLKPVRDEDPREAILRHAEAAKANPTFFGAYAATQPVTIFSKEEEEGII
jgi:WD40 repeat protein